MADRERPAQCPFFDDMMANMPVTTERCERKYCRGNYTGCEQRLVFKALGAGRVPAPVFAHEPARAKQLVAAG